MSKNEQNLFFSVYILGGFMKKIFLALVIVSITSSQVLAVQFAHRVYDANGNRIGTCRKDPYGRTLRLYDNNDRLVKNPEKYINISDDENYLFSVSGHVIGKYNSTRVFIFHNTSP